MRELSYRFRERHHGESKLYTLVAWEYGMLLADKLVGRPIPARFALFGLVGTPLSSRYVMDLRLWSRLRIRCVASSRHGRGNDFQLSF